MYLADYHVHSRISPDASASMQEMAEAAIRLGFHEICGSAAPNPGGPMTGIP